MTNYLYRLPEPEERTAYKLLETLLVDDAALWGKFEDACKTGVSELREEVLFFRSVLLGAGHDYDSHDEQHEETFNALLELAGDYMTGSPGAVRTRLQERVKGSVTPTRAGVEIVGAVGVRQAVEIVVAHEDGFFDDVVLAVSAGHTRLYIVAARIRGALASIGREFQVEEVEDELLSLVLEIAPGSPAARPDAEKMYEMWGRAKAYIGRHPGLDIDELQRLEINALHAARDNAPARYRDALKKLCLAASKIPRKHTPAWPKD